MRTARLYGGCVVVDGTCMEGRRACGSVWEASRDGDDMYVGKEDAGRVWAGGGGGEPWGQPGQVKRGTLLPPIRVGCQRKGFGIRETYAHQGLDSNAYDE